MKLERVEWESSQDTCGYIDGLTHLWVGYVSKSENERRKRALYHKPIYGVLIDDVLYISCHPFYTVVGLPCQD